MGIESEYWGKRIDRVDGILMDENRIRRIAGKQKMPVGTIEKDYVLVILLSKIGRAGFSGELVFKGGTAIKKSYFGEARFSEDLDFTCVKATAPSKLEKFLLKELSNAKIECIQFGKLAKTGQTQSSAKLKLAYSDISGHPQSVNFDLSMREKVLLPVQEKEMTDSYDQPQAKINTMDLTEIMAEKIRALATRGLPRDLYDIWFLSKHGIKIDLSIAEQKLAYYGLQFQAGLISKKIQGIEQNWNRDLERLIRPLPAYEKIAGEISKIIESANQ
jgi:predicted nucleotidyltransferase component of viral defense system